MYRTDAFKLWTTATALVSVVACQSVDVVQTVSVFATCGVPTSTLFPSGFVYSSFSGSPAASTCSLVTASSLPTTTADPGGDSAYPVCASGDIDACSSEYQGQTCRDAAGSAYTFVCAQAPACGVAIPDSAVAKRATQPDFAACLSSCDAVPGCIAASYDGSQCTLHSSLTRVSEASQQNRLAVRYFAASGVLTASSTALSATTTGPATSVKDSALSATVTGTATSVKDSASSSMELLTLSPSTSSSAAMTSSPAVDISSRIVPPPTAATTYASTPAPTAIDWKTYKANGVNLGAWLEKEKTHDPIWWDAYAPDAQDEWTFCQTLGDQCGPVLEARYTSFLNTSTIDALASVGVNTLRIPTTYAAWVVVPGSELYTGSQQVHLREISDYAIHTYNMHVIIGLHNLPGGINNLDIGEAFFHDAWFYNTTYLAYSWQAVDAVLAFINTSGTPTSFTISPLNEASDDLSKFGSAAGLSEKAADWVLGYINGVISRTEAIDKRIPVMMQDSFKGAAYWEPLFPATSNIVMDVHAYYFAAAGIYSAYVTPAICGQSKYISESAAASGPFPVFIGEWSLQVAYNNTYEARQEIFDTQRYAWSEYNSGGSFWTAVSYSNTTVDGQGTQRDYWSYVQLINEGVITTPTNGTYC